MKQVLIKGGSVIVQDVPSPKVGSGNVLVQVTHSCISVGTEMAGVKMSGMPLYQRALKQPDNVKRVLEMVRDQGVKRTMDRVAGKLTAGTPTGYSASGLVIAVGDQVEGFELGDRVACAGAGIANHAEVIDVPVNLAVKVPDSVDLSDACTVTLGAIAMQGVRRAQPTLGETVLVIGLGILGQITAQILLANGCRVIGTDLDAGRIRLASTNGLNAGINPVTENLVERVLSLTDGIGADAVIITAASESSHIVSDAMQCCRKKGRVVLVGDVGLNLKRSDFYQKELDFFISSSYGPGRYDPTYEEGGQDYPLPYVRWTENRNMQSYLALIASGKLRLESMHSAPFAVENASQAYESLKADENKPMMVLLKYPEKPEKQNVTVSLRSKPTKSNKISVGLIGASSFAQGVHLPNLVKLRQMFSIHAVASRTGSNARAIGDQYQAAYCTTDLDEVLSDDNIDLVMITTRHNLHGDMVVRALNVGKHVFVEKPLALTEDELQAIENFYQNQDIAPSLMVGYNRRFSPAIRAVLNILRNRTTPIIANYTMNAGFINPNHWVHGPEGGGRNLGEACHIYDVFAALTGGADCVSVSAMPITPKSAQWRRDDNFVVTLKYSDGSVCTLTYTALGSRNFPKEQLNIFADGQVVIMDDYKSVKVHGSKHKGWTSSTQQKGQLEELEALGKALISGGKWPISWKDQLAVSRVSLEVDRQLKMLEG